MHSVVGHWTGGFDEDGLRRWVEDLRGQLKTSKVTLGLAFMAPRLFSNAPQILEILKVHGQIELLTGCSSQGLIADGQEIEADAGLVLGLYSLPGAELHAVRFTQEQVEEANGPGYWHLETDVLPEGTRGWLAFIDPFHLDAESWLKSWNEAYRGIPVFGGLASGDFSEQTTRVFLDSQVYEDGGVAVAFRGKIRLLGVTSQGCTPIGETWTLTKAEQNVLQEIGNRRAYDVLAETFKHLSPEDQLRARGNLFIGLVINEYLEDFHRGDFLIRNLLGADPASGVISIGAMPRIGQTIQFQRRSAKAATEDMAELLARARKELGDAMVYGGCLCACNGRGRGLFGTPNHDAGMVQQELGPLSLTGFFCNGEIGPVGEKSFLHGYTASLALFVEAK
jgi:small ligand-binding sensory domain FIST